MATQAERREYLEGLSEAEWAVLAHRLGGVELEKPLAKRIKWILDAADRPGSGDEHDRASGLPTNDEQHLELQRDAVGSSKSSARAAWISAGCAFVAIIISLIALWQSLGD